MVFFCLGGVNYEGGRSNQKSSFMRGVIVPPSKLIVKIKFPPKGGFFIRGGLLLRGGDYIYIYIYIHICIYVYMSVQHVGRLRCGDLFTLDRQAKGGLAKGLLG